MGNKNTSPHLTKTLSINGHDPSRSLHSYDDTDNHFETSSYQSSNGKKHGPSPRFRRRQHPKPIPPDRKGRKSQVVQSQLSIFI